MRSRSAADRRADGGQPTRGGARDDGFRHAAAASNGANGYGSVGNGSVGNGSLGNGGAGNGRGAGRRRLAGPAADDWAEPGASRAATGARGSRSRSGETGRGLRRLGLGGDYGPGDYGPGDYGPGDYGYEDGPPAGRPALREPADEHWAEPDRTSRGLRSRIAERQFTHGGGNGRGGGNRGGGRGGGRSPGGDPHSRAGGFKNWLLYGRWWRHWTLKKALAVAGAGIAVCVMLGIAGFFILYDMTPIPTANEETANWQSSTVYFANGKQLGTFDNSIDRILLTPGQIPTVMTQAMTAAEDHHFYTEGGVSLTGLMRAAYQDLRGDGNLQGGSTITMQYAKNYYAGVDTGRNISTKLKEIFIAMKLGHDRSKTWVMTNYLNTVPFGATIDGLGAAAENYFNINLTQPHTTLTVAQAALLAAMPNNPAVFSSGLAGNNPTGLALLKARFSDVLGNLVKDGNITPAQAAQAKFPKITPPPSGNGWSGYTGYLMNMVLQQLEAPYADGGYGLTEQAVDTGGYKIRTTFSMSKVLALARSVNAEKAQMKSLAIQEGTDSFRSYDRIGAVLEDSQTGDIVAVYGGPGYLPSQKRCKVFSCQLNMAEEAEPVGSSFKPYVLATAVKEDMSVFTSKLNGYSPIWIPLKAPPNGPSTQLALSPTSAPPGCSAQQSGTCYSSNGGTYFLFDESAENLHRPLPVNIAAAVSSDPAFEDLAHRDGIDSVINMAQQLGVGQNSFVNPCSVPTNGSVAATIKVCNDLTGPVNGLIPNFSPTHSNKPTAGSPAIALGENPLTPIEQASTFATLADDGVYHTPTVITSVQQNGTTVTSHLTTRTVLSPGAAADVDYALSFDNNYGGGTAEANVPFRRGDLIAKTGTLGTGANASQAWFIAATPRQYALSVALFTNLPSTQNLDNLPSVGGMPGSQGGGWPATIWNEYVANHLNNLPYVSLFPQDPTGFVPWIQVRAHQGKPKKQICKPGGGNNQGGKNQNCVCPPGAPWCAHPNPSPSCQQGFGFGGQCTSPSPSPSCQGFGQSCGSPSPSPSVTPSVSPSSSCSTGPPGQCGKTARTVSYIRSSRGSGRSAGSAASIVALAAEDAATRLAATRLAAALGLVA